MKKQDAGKLQLATFGAGCFWGVEETLRHMKGVKDAVSGYMGGTMEKPSYEDVCTDKTGHAEVVQIRYNPKEVSYEELLNFFWKFHNPTTLNRQGPDVGTQYRSVVFYHTKEQEKIAKQVKDKLNKEKFGGRIVTTIEPAKEFYSAEDYHQKYYEKKGMCGYTCHV